MPVTISKVSDIVVKTSGKTASQTRTLPIILHSDGQGLISWSMLGNGKQTGTPSPQSIIVPTFCGVRTGNLFDLNGTDTSNGYESSKYIGWDGKTGNSANHNISEYISIPDGTTYLTISNVNASTNVYCQFYDSSKTAISIFRYDEIPKTVSVPNNAKFIRCSVAKLQMENFMLNAGSTALPYEPFGYKIPITNTGQTQTAYLAEPLRKIGDYADSAASSGTATRRIGKIVLTGQESIYMTVASGLNRFQVSLFTTADYRVGYCSHYKYVVENANYTVYHTSNNDSVGVYFHDNSISSSNDFKTYLAQQYAAGTPVTVWYVLATPTTETFTAPTIPTVSGENTLTVGTALPPSSMTVTYNSPEYSKCVRVCDAQGRPSLGIHFGFKIDKSKTDPDQAIIYTHDAVTMTPAYMDFANGVFNYGSWGNVWFVKNARPCKLNYNGTLAYYLDPNDYTKKADGTDSGIFYTLLDEEPYDWSTQWKQYYHLDNGEYVLNSDAEAPTFAEDTYYRLDAYSDHYMVEFPKVYFKRYEDANYNYIEISDRKLDPYFHAYAHINADGEELDYIYLPMFKGSYSGSDDALMSLPGVVPPGGTTAAYEVECAEANGDGWQIWDHSSREMINDLLVLMSKNADGQAKFGKGRESGYNASGTETYGKLQTGTLIKKGAFYGYNTSYSDVKVFHIEGFWANRWERLQGLLLVNGVYKIKMAPPYNFTGTDFVTLSTPSPTSNNYARTLATSELGSVTATVSAYASSPFKDYFYQSQSGPRVGLVGGSCNNGSNCGPRSVYLSNGASSTYWGIGASPIYKPLL